jgi:hypothetical protein
VSESWSVRWCKFKKEKGFSRRVVGTNRKSRQRIPGKGHSRGVGTPSSLSSNATILALRLTIIELLARTTGEPLRQLCSLPTRVHTSLHLMLLPANQACHLSCCTACLASCTRHPPFSDWSMSCWRRTLKATLTAERGAQGEVVQYYIRCIEGVGQLENAQGLLVGQRKASRATVQRATTATAQRPQEISTLYKIMSNAAGAH